MAQIVINWTGNGIAKITAAAEKLAGSAKNVALRRALNHTGDKVFTRVKRTLSKQIGASQAMVMKYGKLRRIRANNSVLEYRIRSSGGPIPLKHFKARQTGAGVTAAPWNNRKLYRHAFIVSRLGGHAFWRVSSRRLPIKSIAGPNVPKEMVKDEVAAAFQAEVATSLPPRVEHEVKRLTGGVF